MKKIDFKIVAALGFALLISAILIQTIFIAATPRFKLNWQKELAPPTPSPSSYTFTVRKKNIEIVVPGYVEKPTDNFVNGLTQ